jgi:sulfate adenylyltransferase subunit 1 (EFTu-like GTPase family)
MEGRRLRRAARLRRDPCAAAVGPTLLDLLESIAVAEDRSALPFRMPVQWVSRPDADFRGCAGTVASGRATHIARIATRDGDLASAEAGQAVTLTLAEAIDIARGDLLVAPIARPELAAQFATRLLWMEEAPLLRGRRCAWARAGPRPPSPPSAIGWTWRRSPSARRGGWLPCQVSAR